MNIVLKSVLSILQLIFILLNLKKKCQIQHFLGVKYADKHFGAIWYTACGHMCFQCPFFFDFFSVSHSPFGGGAAPPKKAFSNKKNCHRFLWIKFKVFYP